MSGYSRIGILAALCFIRIPRCIVLGSEIKTHEEGSFYGESYILNPLYDASSTTSISFEFLTHRPQGLLLLAAGHTDYIIVQLNGGMVETRANLGSGEAITFSARGVRLDDSQWHSVVINRTQDIVYLTVDGADQGQATTPGTYHDLNIDTGVLLGGIGNLKKDVYKDVKSFRGCLKDVFFNGRNILEEAKALRSAQSTFQVSWNCDDEFLASSDLPISFSHETSFVAFPHLRIYPDVSTVFACELKTRSANAIVLFNSGIGSTWEDFIAVELVEGKPKLSIDKGSGIIEVALESAINDGKWHELEVTVSETIVQLRIDSEKNLTRFHLGNQNHLNLGSHLFVGGIGLKARSHAMKLGLVSLKGAGAVKGSMLGCVQNIRIDSRRYGFQQVHISHIIDAECKREYPCAQDPCVPNAQCTELEGLDFRCDCSEKDCVKPEFKPNWSEENNGYNGVISVSKLEVRKDGPAVINTNVININSDILKDFAREESITFTVKNPPKEGFIEIRDRRGSQNSFTFRDLTSNIVYYRHYGGRSHADGVTFEVTFGALTQQSESKVRDRYDFFLPIVILPLTRTSLEVTLKSGNVLPITSGARIRVTPYVVDVKTTDMDPSLLVFTITYLRQAMSIFERSGEPGTSITTFTLKDVQDGTIWFQHKEDKTVYTKINVTDGVLISSDIDLRFREEELSISLINNTGISVSRGSDCLITSYNLSAVTNVKLEDLELKYHIIHPPQHGTIQRQEHESMEWVDVELFSQRNIDARHIRYLHLPTTHYAQYDTFRFEAMAKNMKSAVHTFNIIFKLLTLTVQNNNNLVLHHSSYGKFSDKTLMVVSNADKLNLNNIVYRVMRPPQKGSLYLVKRNVNNPAIFDQFPPLKTDGTFTQQDVNDGHVYYKLHHSSAEKADDLTDLQASYFGFTVMVRSLIQYSPKETTVTLVNNGLKDVIEGGSAIISRQELSLEMESFKHFTFSIMRYPLHGSINIIDPNIRVISLSNVSSFTMSEIKEGKVAYYHDDSESNEDSFTFVAIPTLGESENDFHNEIKEFRDTFHIRMKMRNDNPPVRVVNKVFQVAINQVKHITINDLAFADPDINYDNSLLSYHRQTISNGEFLNKITEETVHNFTQEDLLKGNLLFQHRGDNYSRTPILVSDGQFFSNTLFEIQASSPYIKIGKNTGVEVLQGQSVTVNGYNLSIETNLDSTPKDITLQLIEEPKYGHIRVGGQHIMKFSYQDILTDKVRYWQDGGNSREDRFVMAVLLDSVQTQVTVFIAIVGVGQSSPPEIIHNQILKVEALGSEVISSNILQVSHKNYQPPDIEFIITQLPRFGNLFIKERLVKAGSAPEFTQEDINNGQITYTSTSSGHVTDMFIFDVGTDLQSLRQMEFLIEIIPSQPYFTQVNMSCSEGGAVIISDRVLPFRGKIGQNKKLIFRLQSFPVHGKIMTNNGKTKVQVNTFSSDDVSQDQVIYVHDDSESLYDEFIVRNIDSNQLFHIFVNITPINDQPPRVIVNTGLDLWTGSLTLLTSKHLQASDPDSSSTQVEFHVTSSTNGHLAYLNNTFKQISKFTQLELDSGHVVFVHKGSESGEFKFQATDGTNSVEPHVFKVRARPVQISVSINNTLKAFPGILQPITNSTTLATVSASNFDHPIVFTLTAPKPSRGKLVTLVNQKAIDINSFTQNDVNDGKIFYQHTGRMQDWKETDFIYFEIATTYAKPLTHRTLLVDISFANLNEGNYERLLKINPPTLEEGKKLTFSRDQFDSSELVQTIQNFRSSVTVVFSFISSVRRGKLWFKDQTINNGDVFTQADINNGALVYKHDHTDSTEDAFQFAVKILIPRSYGEASSSVAYVFNFTIHILPVNDQGFELITRHPKIEVTQGSEVIVTADNLTTVDLDTGPEGIEYVILTQPDNGMLVRLSNPQSRIISFTQKEINDNMIVFKHDGAKKASGSLYLKVWDKVFEPRYANLDITVFPIYIVVAQDRYIPLVQGSKSVVFSNKFLKVSTNGDFNALKYKITQAPQFGKLLKYNTPVKEFTQTDINRGHLLYVQDKDSPGEDFFVCDIDLSNIDCSLDTVQFEIIMKPLIKQGPLIASSNSYVAITRSTLDASELALITNDVPLFKLLKAPLYGQIMRRQRQRRQAGMENSFHPVSNFTFQDVHNTKIYYVPNRTNKNVGSDKFVYILSARGVPPAKGELIIQLDASDIGGDRGKEEIDSNTEAPNDEDFNPDEKKDKVVQGASIDPNIDDDNSGVIIAVVLTLIFVLIFVVVGVVLFLRWRRRRASAVQEIKPVKPRPYISGPLQLEQPHVLIEPKHDGLGSPDSGENTALVPGSEEENQYINTSNVSTSHNTDSLHHHKQQPSSSHSPDITRVEFSQTVPGYKSTPLADSQSDQTSEDTERHSIMTSGRGSNASADMLDWTLMDPDLLQHCRTTTPVLRNNQYWL